MSTFPAAMAGISNGGVKYLLNSFQVMPKALNLMCKCSLMVLRAVVLHFVGGWRIRRGSGGDVV